MITDQDIAKLEKIFVTKVDLKQELKAYPTKDDLKKELKKYATKDEVAEIVGRATDTMVKEFLTAIEMIGRMSEKIEEISNKLDKNSSEHDDILEHHQRQIDKLNNKVFPTL